MSAPLDLAALDNPATRAGLMATDIRELLAAGGDYSPESWDCAELCDLSPAALSAYLASMGHEARQDWIDDAFDLAERVDDEPLMALAWRANDCAVLLKQGADADAIRISPFRGMVADYGPEDEMPAILENRRPASADLYDDDGIGAGMESFRETAPRFQLLSAADLLALPPLRWRVRGILPTEGLAALYGPPGCGKSFLAIDMLAAIADGRPWFEHATVAAPCVYLGLEGEAGVAQRVQAYCAKRTAPDRLRVVLTPLDLRRADDREELAAAIRTAGMGEGVVAIDTLNRAAPGIDENDASSMGLLIEAAKQLREQVGGLVLLVHHAGKDITRGLRGHSSLLAALDCVLEVTREGDRRGWQLAKAKDAGDDEARPFRLDVVELGDDADGWPVSSCVVEPEMPAADAVGAAKYPHGGNQRIVWDGIRKLLKESKSFGQAGAPMMRPCIRLDDALVGLHGCLACEPKRQSERIGQAITGLVNRGVLALREGWLWSS